MFDINKKKNIEKSRKDYKFRSDFMWAGAQFKKLFAKLTN